MKKNTRILTLVFVVAFLTLLVGCFPAPTPPNQTPIITSIPITTATVGVLYTYDVNATDPDGDTLIYSLITKPTGMTINSKTGVISWIPTSTQVGKNSVIVRVSDGSLSIIQSFTIKVSTLPLVNQAPIIYSTPITTATVGVTYFYDVEATDPNGDILTYSLTTCPSGMTISSASGLIMWIPTVKGNYAVVVKVSDGALSDTQPFTIIVSAVEPEPEPEPEPELTKIIVDPKVMDLIVGGFETFEVTAHYDNDTTKIVTFKCRYGTSNSSIAYVAYGIDKVITLNVGTATIFISYTQHNFLTGEEITKTDEIAVTVKVPPPVIDGVLSLGEWDGATEIPVAGDMGIVKVLATTDYLYVLFDVVDSTDARLGQQVGNDKIGLNINPTDGYDILFQTGTDPDAWQGPSSGLTDDYETQWLIDGTQYDIPDDLDTITLYSEGMRVSEWKIPLVSIDLSAGDVLKIGGATDIDVENRGLSFRYPIGLEWDDASTYVNIIVY